MSNSSLDSCGAAESRTMDGRLRETEWVVCPTCGPGDQSPLLSVGGWNVVRCQTCGLAMVNPRRKHAAELYEADAYFSDERYYYDYVGNKSAYQKGFRTKLTKIKQYCPEGGKLLDVGAAYGFFMEESARFGFQPYGVELSRHAAESATQYGPVFNQPLSAVQTDCRFEAVTFIDSLEHFENPVEGLCKAHELLEGDGVVALMVPNIESAFARIMGTRWHLLLPEEHLFYFSASSIRAMLKRTGFEILHLGSGGYGRSLAEVLHVLLRGRISRLGALEKALQRVTFEVNLGDIFAIARKAETSSKSDPTVAVAKP